MEPSLPTTTASDHAPPDQGFDAFYRTHRSRLVATVNAATRCGADAATDAVDEAFVRALKHWSRVAVMDAPAGWVFTVARNHVTRTRSRMAKESHLLPTSRLGAPAPTSPDLAGKQALWDAVAALPERQRHAVALRYLADLTEDQIASTMGIARGTVAATLHAARGSLAERLRDGEPSRTARKESRHG